MLLFIVYSTVNKNGQIWYYLALMCHWQSHRFLYNNYSFNSEKFTSFGRLSRLHAASFFESNTENAKSAVEISAELLSPSHSGIQLFLACLFIAP